MWENCRSYCGRSSGKCAFKIDGGALNRNFVQISHHGCPQLITFSKWISLMNGVYMMLSVRKPCLCLTRAFNNIVSWPRTVGFVLSG